jgi:hypothetical protein
MGIKMFSASADTTITNAFKPDLRNRGTGSNMGFSDVLEVFSIYGHASASSEEIARTLLKFPITNISTERTNSNIPESGSVDFYLRLFNARHASALPKNFTLEVRALTKDWEEGTGLDMDEYKDETFEDEGANWMYASSGSAWSRPGGDFKDDELSQGSTDNGNAADRVYFQTFTDGPEDLEVNITEMVEEWIAGTTSNYGVVIKLTGSQEPYFSSSVIVDNNGSISGNPYSGSSLHNLTGSEKSYYTKKFFARSSQYFMRRPRIEARWDSSKTDDRGKFYLSSALAPETDNFNTLYLYNFINGRLRDIPSVGEADSALFVGIWKGGPDGPSTDSAEGPIELRQYIPNKTDSASGSVAGFTTFATGGWVETGIYTASVAVTGALQETTSGGVAQPEYYYDVWQTGDEETSSGKGVNDRGMTTLFTGSAISPKKFDTRQGNPNPTYVNVVPNLKNIYSRKEEARFRLIARQKDWSPTIYTVAKNAQQDTKIINNAYYKAYRVVDDYEVLPYGTGSTSPQASGSAGSYTRLSYDVSGNYFDLDMSVFEPGYSYAFKFVYYVNGSYKEQPEVFKFRVEE